MTIKRTRLLLALGCTASLAFSHSVPANAQGEAGGVGWRVSTRAYPTNLPPQSAGRDEVQEVTVHATSGTIALTAPERNKTASVSWNATAAELQQALEQSIYGSGNVAVSGGPGGSAAYVVTFVGAYSDRRVEPLASAAATVSERTVGASSKAWVQIRLAETGKEASTGTVTVTDQLPNGLSFSGKPPELRGEAGTPEPWSCAGTTTVTCTGSDSIFPGEVTPIDLEVNVANVAGSLRNMVDATGGGALVGASADDEVVVSRAPASFGVADLEAWATNPAGGLDTQAGSHPYELTLSFDLNTTHEEGALGELEHSLVAGGEARDISVALPPGFIGDPGAAPECTREQFDAESCPLSTQIGVDTAYVESFGFLGFPVHNLVPPPGIPAQFGFQIQGIETFLDAHVRSGGDYGITENVEHIVQRGIVSNTTTIWGVPSDPSHDPQRCEGVNACGKSVPSNGETPFVTLPTACGAPPSFSVEADSWLDPALSSRDEALYSQADGTPAGMTGCADLSLSPQVSIVPDTSAGDTPAGLSVDIKVPQEGLLQGGGVSTADIADTVVTLPEGLVINPGQAAGLQACQAGEDGIGSEAAPSCPLASKVGTVAISTPLLPDKLEGDVYVLQSNPPHLQLLVAASGDGVDLKLVGEVDLDEATGRLTTTFRGTPQLPFTDFTLNFSGGAQAALATPTGCGTYTSTVDFTPWSTPFSPDAYTNSSFQIDSGPGGGGCSAPLPFAPTLIAGSTTDQAGGYTDFSLLLQRGDGQQRISTLQFQTPAGLLGMISKVPLCGEQQAAAGTCPAASQIGHTVVAAGPGPYPLVVPEPGRPAAPIYLTGGYKGAPYGLSIVVPVVAGPFNLGTVVVRAAIAVDPHTAQLRITTDPLPAILDGIPTDLRSIDAVIDRPGFMFNPTDCQAQAFSGVATSTQGTSAPIASRFQVGSCGALPFKPDFKVTTTGKTSREGGASLDAKIIYPTIPLGANQASSQANIARVKVELPKQLSARLSTLQKACLAAVFAVNPANCPPASVIGYATVQTPVLPVPISGPAYFISHGGEAFPSLTMVLQGYGVTIELVGTTFISKRGITSSTFNAVPDVPIGSFELRLPQGPHSALSAIANLCKSKLLMPTEFMGQNGASIKQSTTIAVTGCAKKKTAGRRSRTSSKRKGGRGGAAHSKRSPKARKRRRASKS